MTSSLPRRTLRVATCRLGFSAIRTQVVQPLQSPPVDYTLRMRHTVHEITQPLTAIVLLSELKIALGQSDSDSEAIYAAALQLRELVAELQEILQSTRQQAPAPYNLRVG